MKPIVYVLTVFVDDQADSWVSGIYKSIKAAKQAALEITKDREGKNDVTLEWQEYWVETTWSETKVKRLEGRVLPESWDMYEIMETKVEG